MIREQDAFSLNGRVAVATGAASGIGRAIAIRFAGAGATVVCADIDEAGVKETMARAGGATSAAIVDVTNRADVVGLVTHTVETHGRLDVMCNNAGIMSEARVVDVDEDELDRVISVNLKGVFFGAQAAARVMRDAGCGTILNVSSGVIDLPGAGVSAYAMTKAAVAQLTRALAAELGDRGVRVNAIAPGLVETGITQRHYQHEEGGIDQARREQVLVEMGSQSPLRVVGVPDDIAWAALYLASDAARFVTGQVVRINGGAAMPL